MITFEDAIQIIDKHATPLPEKRVYIGRAAGRFLAEDLAARYDSPPFDNSAVDGFGRRADDLSAPRLRLVGKLKAGDKGAVQVNKGQTVRIFTGAPVPKDIAAISMQEDCETDGEWVVFKEASELGDHIRRAGGDFLRGDTVLRKGDYLGPAAVGIAISAGLKDVSVTQIPMVSMLTSGTELLGISHELMPGKIYDSNFHALTTAVGELLDEWTITTASDKPEVLRKKMLDAMQGEVVITTGGVSVGEHDLIKEEFAHWHVTERFWRVAIKPGKPVYFGTLGKKLVFGLPGNPVSALVTYYLFARPAILKMMGHPDPWPKPVSAKFEGECCKKPGRMEFLRGVLSQNGTESVARVVGEQGSHQMAAMAAANCLIHFPLEVSQLKSGDEVDVTPLIWGIT
ncbi:MAG: gephyrin-like molybdotransferase Glp [Fimbriimonadales bacterium]